VERITLAKCDQALGKRASRFGSEQSGLNAFLLDEVGHEIAQRSAAMCRIAPQFVA
jgi:hypothetical protein